MEETKSENKPALMIASEAPALQPIFDKIVSGLASQGWKQSATIGGSTPGDCLYRGPNGCKCAIGWLIDDDAYSERLEGSGAHSNKVQAALKASGVEITRGFVALSNYAQYLHDSRPDDMEAAFRKLASAAGFEFNVSAPEAKADAE